MLFETNIADPNTVNIRYILKGIEVGVAGVQDLQRESEEEDRSAASVFTERLPNTYTMTHFLAENPDWGEHHLAEGHIQIEGLGGMEGPLNIRDGEIHKEAGGRREVGDVGDGDMGGEVGEFGSLGLEPLSRKEIEDGRMGEVEMKEMGGGRLWDGKRGTPSTVMGMGISIRDWELVNQG